MYLQVSFLILRQFILYNLATGFYFGDNFVLNALDLESVCVCQCIHLSS